MNSGQVVGGAVMAPAHGRDGVTPDIDALASHRAVAEEARAMADDHGLTDNWLNGAAGPWIPPRPKAARRRPTTPGLTVHIASPEHLLAMKLAALRRKDRPDVRLLGEHLDMADASAEGYADLLERVYSGEGRLVTGLSIPGEDPDATRTEALAIGRWGRHDFAPAAPRPRRVPRCRPPTPPARWDSRRAISTSRSAAVCS